MKSKSLILMVLSLGFGLIAAIGISQVMGRNSNPQPIKTPTQTVLVAAEDLEYKTILTEEMVREEEWPLDIVPPDAVTSLEQITDMATRTYIPKQMPLSLSNIVHKKQLNDINVPRDHQVISVKVSAEDNMHGLLQAGDRVNIIGYVKGKTARTFLRGLRVHNVNAQMTATTGGREEKSSKSDAIVGIIANDRQAELITFVLREGGLKLTMVADIIDDEELGGHIDEEGAVALGLPGVDDGSQAEPESLSPIAFQSPPPQPTSQKPTMKVWTPLGVEVFTFRDGIVDRPRPFPGNSPTSANPPPTEFNGNVRPERQEDISGFDEVSRGLDEDQYLPD